MHGQAFHNNGHQLTLSSNFSCLIYSVILSILFLKRVYILLPPKENSPHRISYVAETVLQTYASFFDMLINIILGYKMYLIQGSFWPRENSRGNSWLRAKSETVTLLVSIFDGIRLRGMEYFILKLYFYVNVRELYKKICQIDRKTLHIKV